MMGNNLLGKRTNLLSRHNNLSSNPQKSYTNPGVVCRLLAQLQCQKGIRRVMLQNIQCYPLDSLWASQIDTPKIYTTLLTHTYTYVNTHTELREIKKKCITVGFHQDM